MVIIGCGVLFELIDVVDIVIDMMFVKYVFF